MNINVKLALDKTQLNRIAKFLSQNKHVKRTATRKEVVQLVRGYLRSLISDVEGAAAAGPASPESRRIEFDASKVPEEYRDKPIEWQKGWYRGRYVTTPSVR